MSIYREAAQLLERDVRPGIPERDLAAARASGDPRVMVQTCLRAARDRGLPIRSDTAAAVRDLLPPNGTLDPTVLDGLQIN